MGSPAVAAGFTKRARKNSNPVTVLTLQQIARTGARTEDLDRTAVVETRIRDRHLARAAASHATRAYPRAPGEDRYGSLMVKLFTFGSTAHRVKKAPSQSRCAASLLA